MTAGETPPAYVSKLTTVRLGRRRETGVRTSSSMLLVAHKSNLLSLVYQRRGWHV
jgi:hypothetical protein